MKKRLEALPELLLAASGERILTADQWQTNRRPEVLELFRENVFGKEPVQRPEGISFHVEKTEGAMDGAAIRKRVTISFDGPNGQGSFPLHLLIPSDASGPVPAFLLINNRGRELADPERATKTSFWPAETIISRGYAAAVILVEDIDPDVDDGFLNGIHGILDVPADPRPGNAWGTIAAWAWGACRAMDYLETDSSIDSARVAVVGHSRGGKTALWAGAVDQRFAMVVSNNSGCTGAAITRGKQGETVRNINDRFPHWFNGNYKSFNGRENELPIDQHMLLALIAPRLLYVSSATEDLWADPESEFLSLLLAEPAYRLYGTNALGRSANQMPLADSPIFSEKTGYHIRTGKHDLTEYDWKQFIDFADRSYKLNH
jgi:hypothetical protein